MSTRADWLFNPDGANNGAGVDGLVPVRGFVKKGRTPEEVAVMEKAAHHGADAVFFEASRDGKPPVAQAFIYRSDGAANDPAFT